MRADELRAAGSTTGTALDEVTEVVRDTHRAVAGRVFGVLGSVLGPAVTPARLLHDGIAEIAYTSTRLGVRAAPIAAATAAGAVQAAREPAAASSHDGSRGRAVLGALSGVLGDRLAREQAPLAPQLRMRLHDAPLRHEPANLAHDALGSATGRIVVFVHGLCETDLAWSYAAERRWGSRDVTYGSRLRADGGWTPIYANVNTGAHISANALELADRLAELVAMWPVPVRDIALVGHSMGGLIARSAAHQGHERGDAWVPALRHVIGLGTPHLGAPMERLANRVTHQLTRLPETRPIARLLNQRSVGIKDLRHGALLEADWSGGDPDGLQPDRVTPAVLIPGVRYSSVSATLSRTPYGIFAHDLLVAHGSAHGVGPVRSIPFEPGRSHHVGRRHHFDLLADPSVYRALRDWLAEDT